MSDPHAHRAEVKGMLLTEYNEAEQMQLLKRMAGEKTFVKLYP